MKKLILASAVALALGGCVSHNFSEGERVYWRCAEDRAFNLRHVSGGVEVFAAGQTHALPPSGDDYSNGTVTYSVNRGRATLTGAPGGPFENCRRTGVLPRLW